MRSFVPAYELRTPSTLEDALALLADAPGRWRPFAGGTDLMVLLEAGRLPHTHYVSLWGIEALRFIEVTEERVAIDLVPDAAPGDVLLCHAGLALERVGQ